MAFSVVWTTVILASATSCLASFSASLAASRSSLAISALSDASSQAVFASVEVEGSADEEFEVPAGPSSGSAAAGSDPIRVTAMVAAAPAATSRVHR